MQWKFKLNRIETKKSQTLRKWDGLINENFIFQDSLNLFFQEKLSLSRVNALRSNLVFQYTLYKNFGWVDGRAEFFHPFAALVSLWSLFEARVQWLAFCASRLCFYPAFLALRLCPLGSAKPWSSQVWRQGTVTRGRCTSRVLGIFVPPKEPTGSTAGCRWSNTTCRCCGSELSD